MKLTAKTIAAIGLPEGKADAIYFDDAMPGFGLRLRKTGEQVRRQFVVQYRHAGNTRRLLLGSADVLGVEQARAAAKKALGAVALGGDPQSEKAERRERDVFTMSALVKDYLAAKAGSVRARTQVESVRYLTDPRYFGPLHRLPVEKITRRDVASRVLAIANERGATTGSRARSALSAMFTWAMQMGVAEANPTIGTAEPKTPPARDRVLSDAELTAIWNAAGHDDFGRIVRLLALTGQRRNEVGGMAWSELTGGVWTIPAARAKNGRAHTLPLSGLAVSIIESVPERVDRDQLFGWGDRGFSSWGPAKAALDSRLGNKVAKWTLHDIRRSVATRMCDLQILPHIVEQILNHQSGHRRGVVAVYNRSAYEQPVKAAIGMWADHVRTLVEGGERKVVSFPPAARDGA